MGNLQKQTKLLNDEKLVSLKIRPWELFGFGCYYAWFFSVIIAGTIFDSPFEQQWSLMVRIGFSIGLAAGYALLFVFRKHHQVVGVSKQKIILAGILGTAGTCLVVIPSTLNQNITMLVVASLCTGLGNAFLMMAGGEFWAANRPERAMMQLSVSVVAAITLFIALSLLPIAARIPLIPFLPLCCALILSKSKGGQPRTSNKDYRTLLGTNLERRFMASVCLIPLVAGMVLGISGNFYPAFLVNAFVYTGALLASIVAFTIALKTIASRFIGLLTKIASTCLLLGLVLLLGQIETLSLFGIVVFISGYVLYDEFLWLLHSELIHQNSGFPADVLPRFEMVQWVGFSVGLCVSQGFSNLFFVNNWQIAYVLVPCGIIAVVVLTCIFSNTDAMRIAEVRSRLNQRISLENRCHITAERYRLSTRESEVLILLARGRSIPYIQDELCIAQGTVKSHVRHIYDKLGVSSKQALIDLVDEAE